ncbi:sigma-54-dependent transcriptional regulator [Pedobacter hartonius]|uniref:DNA-binding transcriptional response regulator, NtrC family, contains REC, AAA-type ATPase, and a Fis-type DNA-binding domains n=1 Tax=Pedobacter hartonius TaxID=425514 RepID=A0A1H4CPY3_9SPHI|nr:sigma-54 dependent transcriptional regulator [Pedobacter hartonius]SEA62407.1 DNA-binding transcriptional response regulator, NtrC family, contains REC, AAA-type ATPase, and a Fis-type DNA-binding domains [Pedobacter hartonius]
MQDTVLIIDDEKKICNLLSRIIELEGFKVFQAGTGKEGLKLLKTENILVVLSDVKLPDFNGVELVKEIKKIRPATEVINLTAFGTIADGVMAMRNGAFDYITKGDDNDKIIPLLYRAMEKAKLTARVSDLENRITRKYNFDFILGKSNAIKEAVSLAQKVAATSTTVLLLGETGTGKEVFAQAIHYEGTRRLKPFVAVNCSSLNTDLLESELFGYKAGAFTGAIKDKRGLLEEAHEGTIFLDEIGEMSLDLQSKLLRVLESQTYIKVGDTQTSQVNVRVIAATNRDLKKEAEEGRFRLDLFYRLSVFSIELPPLSRRREDILPIAMHYLAEFTAKVNKPELSINKEFSRLLSMHNWKGNIRELKNVMERVVILADGNEISENLLPYEFHNEIRGTDPLNMQEMEKQHIVKALRHTRGNKTETSRLLGIGLTTLYRKIEEYKIDI